MEIRTYLSTLLRYWWLILLTTIVAGAGAWAFDRVQTPLYRAHARVYLRPAATLTDQRTIVDLLGQMGGRYIVGTYAQTFTSAQVKDEARKAVALSAQGADDYDLEANILPDSAIIEVSGSGPSAVMLANYLNATVDAGVRSSRDLFQVIELLPLEAASIPQTPAKPTPSRDIPTAAGLGLALGILLALALDYLRGPAPVVQPPPPALAARPPPLEVAPPEGWLRRLPPDSGQGR